MKRLIACTAVLSLAGLAPAWAGPSSNVAWTLETMRLVESGNPEKGKQLNATCAGCHGAEGLSALPINPHVAGQDAAYTYKQLKDYKDRTRNNPIMSGMVAALSDQDMADLSIFYASLSLPPPSGTAPAETPRLVTEGEGERLIPACNTCHGRKGEGNPGSKGMPALAGQTVDYLKATMQAYRSGARANDVYSVMRSISKNLTDQEIAALAAYYAAQDAR
jgi:cytochrome c553